MVKTRNFSGIGIKFQQKDGITFFQSACLQLEEEKMHFEGRAKKAELFTARLVEDCERRYLLDSSSYCVVDSAYLNRLKARHLGSIFF